MTVSSRTSTGACAAALAILAVLGAIAAAPRDLAAQTAAAQTAPEPAATPASTDTGQPSPPGSGRAAFDTEAAVAAYLARQTPEQKARSDAYFEGGYWLQLWGFLYGLAVAWLLLGSGLSVRMRDLAARLTRRPALQSTLYAVEYVVAVAVLGFPLTVYQGFFREHRYGLATQTFGPWFKEQLIGLALGVVLGGLLLTILYAVFRRAPRTWWLWGSLVGVVFLAFVVLIAPVYIDPLFNTYTALEDPALREPILSLARANGIHADKVYEFDASRQTTRISANVSGFLGTMRIRLNDNLLERCTPEEIAAVMAHEIGHYALNHVYETIIFFGLVLVGGFAWVRWGFDRALARWGGRWGVRGLTDPAGLPLLAALLSIYFFALTPVLNTYIRVNEVEADIYGLNAARQPDGFATVALKLGEYRKLSPGPIEEWTFYDHPSGRSRIRMAMEWKAEMEPER